MSRPAILGGDAVLAHGRPYAERADIDTPWHDRLALGLHATLVEPLRQRLSSDEQRMMRAIAEATHRHDPILQAETDEQLRHRLPGLRARLRRQGFDLPLVGECFSLIREAAGRTLGLRHHDTQLMAGWALLQGHLAEMATGEGKTFAGTLAAATMALSGSPVHVITVNDYLAERDAAKMTPLYRFLGLEVGVVVQGMARPARRQAYACAITYCTNKELAFDYLRDRVATQKRASRMHLALQRLGGDARDEPDLVLRGLHFAIVDEADSVFIDEARTPLILSVSRDAARESADAEAALALASQLVQGQDYSV
ncbi:MAG TPA: prepilin peptidase, partial [Aquabacterium sp.]|nr:prepilin peptidase [Aquabacterium sp.]